MRKDPKMHSGHFQRIRQRMMRESVDTLDATVVLEMILQLPIRRGDTNEIAKRIIYHFGGFDNFCNHATYDELIKVNGVGSVVAKKIVDFLNVLKYSKAYPSTDTDVNTSSITHLVDYLYSFYKPFTEETLMLFIMNKNYQICHEMILAKGDIDHVSIDFSEIPKTLRYHKGNAIFIAHNHPDGNVTPSAQDILTTQNLIDFCNKENISFFDHIIIGEEPNYTSFSESGLVKEIMQRLQVNSYSGAIFVPMPRI